MQLRAKAQLELRARESRNKVVIARTVDESIQWIKDEFYIPELNGPMEIFPYQEAALRESYRRDKNGKYIYSVVVWSDVKKSLKSCLAAAVALERMTDTKWGSAKIIGNDIKQADSRAAFYARRAVQLNPRLREHIQIVKYKLVFDNHAVIEAIPIDPTGEAGGNDDLIAYTEVWGLKDKADIKMWEEQRISPTKFGQGQIWVESYAGYEGESPILWNLYEHGVLNGEQIDVGIPGLQIYRNGTQLTLWNQTPRLPWQTQEYYASEASSMTDEAFRRVHRNEWVSPLSTFVPHEWWDRCKQEDIRPLLKNEPIIVSLDAGITSDNFAVVAVSRNDGVVEVRYARRWIPPKNGKIDFSDVESELVRLHKEYNCVEFAFDPAHLYDMSARLRTREGMNFREFPQGQDRLEADKHLYDIIRDRRIMHNGEVELREHIANANAKSEGEKLRLVKRQDSKKIDCAVALSMGAYRTTKILL